MPIGPSAASPSSQRTKSAPLLRRCRPSAVLPFAVSVFASTAHVEHNDVATNPFAYTAATHHDFGPELTPELREQERRLREQVAAKR